MFIRKIFDHIKPFLAGYPLATSFWSLILIGVLVFLNQLNFLDSEFTNSYPREENFGFGGPVEAAQDPSTLSSELLIATNHILKDENVNSVSAGAALSYSYPSSNVIVARNGLKKYRIQRGDTLSGIAADFGISVETIRTTNPDLKKALQAGQELLILPVSGVLYETKDGDSLDSVASLYRLDPNLIKQYNSDYQKLFESPGRTVILPFAKPLARADYVNRYVKGLLDLKNYFVLPARGWNWGELHDVNAVDIADQCGKPIYASAEGLVIPDEKLGDGTSGWNNGYGLFILIEHPNGVRTRYSHNSKNLVRSGDYVSQGDEIALIGNTGNTHGPSGCHLHFEVLGARNPFAIK